MSASQSSQRIKIAEGFYMVPPKRTATRVQSATLFKPSNPSVGATYVQQAQPSPSIFFPPKGPYPKGAVVPEAGGAKKKAAKKTTKQTKAKTNTKKAKK
jgi:hypothetical protein